MQTRSLSISPQWGIWICCSIRRVSTSLCKVCHVLHLDLSHGNRRLIHSLGYDSFSFPQPPSPCTGNGFSLNRLDPLRGKCDDIIELLKRASSHDTDETIYGYITRQNMVHLCHLYGKHFQQNIPFIHAPTFDMTQSPPPLLLAIMLVGACYAPDTIFPSQVVKLARRLLTAIALEPVSSHFLSLSSRARS